MSAREGNPAGWAYPAYRRMVGGSSLFLIEGPRRFIELQRIGSRLVKHEVEAVAYPEQLRIMDMLSCANGAYVVIPREEWERAMAGVA